MKFYLAARFDEQKDMQIAAAKLVSELGGTNMSSWVFGGEDGLSRRDIAVKDLEDIDKSDIVILFTHPHKHTLPTSGGKFVEFGYAMAKGLTVCAIGHYENVFIHHPDVKLYPTLADFILDQRTY